VIDTSDAGSPLSPAKRFHNSHVMKFYDKENLVDVKLMMKEEPFV